MKNIKKKFNKIVKYFNYIINLILLKKTNKSKNKSFNKIRFKISNFNKYLITLISILFVYLFYLTLPSLYNKTWVQNTIEKKLLNEFKINFSISSQISYEILPSPHFTIKNVKIIDGALNNPKELAEIRNLKIYISQKNIFNKNKLEIKSILIDDANFLLQENNFDFFSKFLNKKFLKKKINITNSNIFFKNFNEETIFITKISKLSLFYDDLKLINQILLQSEVFNIPFKLNMEKDLNKKNIIRVHSEKLKLKFQNQSIKDNNIINGLNELSFLNKKLISKYELKDNILSFTSVNSQWPNNKIDYNGKLNFQPFNLNLEINLEKVYLMKLLNSDSIFFELIKSKKLFHDNLTSTIIFNSPNILDNKILNELKINFKIVNGEISLDHSYILSKAIGLLKLSNSKLILDDDNLVFNSNFNLSIKNSKSFFFFFQTPKKIRKQIKNISFNLNFAFLNNELEVNSFKIDGLELNQEIKEILSTFNETKNNQIDNLIMFKSLINKIFAAYDG
tara:strand:+ start:685 stop:2208 length:1524 start_codon:yes stop_codon:yes gene_type:complete